MITMFLTESIGSNLLDITFSNVFIDISSLARETKAQIKYWGYWKQKAFIHQRKLSTKQSIKLVNGEKYFQMIYPIRV